MEIADVADGVGRGHRSEPFGASLCTRDEAARRIDADDARVGPELGQDVGKRRADVDPHTEARQTLAPTP